MSNTLQEFAREIHAQNKAVGWWDGEPCIYEKMQLISTEIAEATEGERKDLMDDKLKHRKMGEVELADTLIRTLDLGERLGLAVDDDDEHQLLVNEFSKDQDLVNYSIGKLHLSINNAICKFAEEQKDSRYNTIIVTILVVGRILNYDIMTAAREKHEFNKTRADHKRENRAAAHGKKF